MQCFAPPPPPTPTRSSARAGVIARRASRAAACARAADLAHATWLRELQAASLISPMNEVNASNDVPMHSGVGQAVPSGMAVKATNQVAYMERMKKYAAMVQDAVIVDAEKPVLSMEESTQVKVVDKKIDHVMIAGEDNEVQHMHVMTQMKADEQVERVALVDGAGFLDKLGRLVTVWVKGVLGEKEKERGLAMATTSIDA